MSPLLETIAIGDEILAGKISDTNSTFVAEELFLKGLRLQRQTVIPDVCEAIETALRQAAKSATAVICFGGLGPTSDDKTAAVVAGILRCDLVEDSASLERLKNYYAERGRELTSQGRKQVLYPRSAEVLPNLQGMAPGFTLRLGECQLFFLPGVPREMRAMFMSSVLPQILAKCAGSSSALFHRTWACLGIAESDLQRLMDPVESELGTAGWLGYRTRFPENHLTLYVLQTEPKAEQVFATFSQRLRQLLGPYAYGEDGATLESLVIARLAALGKHLVVAESCTGGAVSARLTLVPGASRVFWGGGVVYRRESKAAIFDVNPDTELAAVSESCSEQLATESLGKSGADFSLAVTGYLGPTGGTEHDPIGTIYCAVGRRVAGCSGAVRTLRVVLPPRDRGELQHGAVCHALRFLLAELEK